VAEGRTLVRKEEGENKEMNDTYRVGGGSRELRTDLIGSVNLGKGSTLSRPGSQRGKSLPSERGGKKGTSYAAKGQKESLRF